MARFDGAAIFGEPEGEGANQETLDEVTFKRWVDFRWTKFAGVAKFGGAHFARRARFRDARFEAGATFKGATFSRTRSIGPMEVVQGELELDRVAFGAPVRVRVTAPVVSCEGAQFQGLTTIELRSSGGKIELEEAAFAEPSTVTSNVSGPRPKVVKLARANVAHLTLAEVDLTECRFLDVHNLDGLRFEGAIDFPDVEGRWRTNRQAIADEVEFRSEQHSSVAAERGEADRVARAYRALRKGREDSKDAPGAADFYYGEMEMRRRAARGVEGAVLTLYWLVSGYGLRASRAALALAATVLVFAFAFDAWAFDPDGPFGQSLLFSAESTSSLFRAPTPPDGATLTDAGRVLQMCLRLLGPLFFGLALLALRGRVKR